MSAERLGASVPTAIAFGKGEGVPAEVVAMLTGADVTDALILGALSAHERGLRQHDAVPAVSSPPR